MEKNNRRSWVGLTIQPQHSYNYLLQLFVLTVGLISSRYIVSQNGYLINTCELMLADRYTQLLLSELGLKCFEAIFVPKIVLTA